MNHQLLMKVVGIVLFAGAMVVSLGATTLATVQNPQLQQRVAEVKQALAANRRSLARYTWLEQQMILVKGELKKEQLFQVQLGPDGKPQKMPVSSSSSSAPKGPIRKRIAQNMTAEYERYGQQIAALAQSYSQPDPQRLQQAYQNGNVTVGPLGSSGEVRLTVANYLKPKDSVGIVFNQTQKAIRSLEIASYLDEPSNAVTISARFSKLADGTVYMSDMVVNGASKQLTVKAHTSDYQKR